MHRYNPANSNGGKNRMTSQKRKKIKTKKLRQLVAENKGLSISYIRLLDSIKNKIKKAQIKAALSVNKELIYLYWDIGMHILEQQEKESWGKSIVEQLSKDLENEFPNVKGFSPRNLWDMRRFYDAYRGDIKLRQLVAEIPWGHNLVILQKVKDPPKRVWYIQKTIENGWSRNVLLNQIDSNLYRRKGNAITNFKKTLPDPQSDLAHQILKNPYNFNFLTLDENMKEKELEDKLIEHIKDFLLELGVGFAFIGRQQRLEIGNQDFYIDLLFYHTRLHAYVVVELKTGEFKPEFASKVNFYLSAVDDMIKLPEDNPSIGIILCKSKNKVIVEYALKNVEKPIGVAEYIYTKRLPKDYKGNLPTIKELEAEITKTDKKK